MKSLISVAIAIAFVNFAHSYSIPDTIGPPEGCNHTALRLWLNQACYHTEGDNSLNRGKRGVHLTEQNGSESTQKPTTDSSSTNLYDYLLPKHKAHHSHKSHHHHHLSKGEQLEMNDKIIELLVNKMRTENSRQKRRLFTDESVPLMLKDKCCAVECGFDDLIFNC